MIFPLKEKVPLVVSKMLNIFNLLNTTICNICVYVKKKIAKLKKVELFWFNLVKNMYNLDVNAILFLWDNIIVLGYSAKIIDQYD